MQGLGNVKCVNLCVVQICRNQDQHLSNEFAGTDSMFASVIDFIEL